MPNRCRPWELDTGPSGSASTQPAYSEPDKTTDHNPPPRDDQTAQSQRSASQTAVTGSHPTGNWAIPGEDTCTAESQRLLDTIPGFSNYFATNERQSVDHAQSAQDLRDSSFVHTYRVPGRKDHTLTYNNKTGKWAYEPVP
ncbi:uncharacterized protein L203_105953 [Cryptococcus depauperatus CBS 7841]|uniref:Uncharacterized protein n=1 Tax=Cryptococcus depauperatus CBS 7841 TaxID=1295531 RepID=A0AAJ8JY41_9TREE